MLDYQGRLMESAATLAEALQLRDTISQKLGKVYVYAHLKKDEDTTNSKYVAFDSRASSLYVEVASAMSFISPEILKADEKTVRSYIENYEPLQVYTHYLGNCYGRRHTPYRSRRKRSSLRWRSWPMRPVIFLP